MATKSGSLRHFIIPFLLAAALYVLTFSCIERRRHVHGPWQVTFTRDSGGMPMLSVNQPYLKIQNVRIVFPNVRVEQPGGPQTLHFEQPPAPPPFPAPFGQVIFLDTSFLPGSVTFRLYGHEVELLPRVMVVDQREIAWKSGSILALPAREARFKD